MHRYFTFQECLQGEAAGFKLTSLERMMEIKSMTPNQSLLHYMIKMAQDVDTSLLKFLSDLQPLDKVARYDLNIDIYIIVAKYKIYLYEL